MTKLGKIRVGVLFGGRSGEHEVSLASARNVMDALAEAGHEVVPIGITRQGRWLTTDDPMKQLTYQAGLIEKPRIEKPANKNERATTEPEHVTIAQSENATAVPVQHGSQQHGSQQHGSQQHGSQQHGSQQHGSQQWGLIPTLEQEPLPAIDVLFPVLHGPYGEDGTIQGLLEMVDLPYVGCGVLSSAVAMDKVIAKKLFAAEGMPQTDYRVVMRDRWQREPALVLQEVESRLGYPLFVKPANLGSSVGISQATNRAELEEALALAASYDRKLVIEAAVPSARELEVSVLGISHSLDSAPKASVVGEIVPERPFYDYAAKYEDEASELLIPAPLTTAQSERIRQMAIDAFTAVDGSGLARVDFLLSEQSGELYLNEVNTMPGFTRISMYPKLWEATGISYPQLVDRLIQLALIRHQDRQNNSNRR